MRNKVLIALAALAGVAVIVLFVIYAIKHAGPEVKSGQVTNKWYEAESGYYIQQCYAYDKNMTCTVQMPVWQDVPATWNITLQDCSLNTKGGCPTEDWSIDQSVWNNIKIGQQFTIKDN